MKYSPAHAPVRNADGGIMPGDGEYNTNYFEYEPVVLSARIVSEFNKIPMLGDLWLSTWASDTSSSHCPVMKMALH